jgi:hypothetical protein
VNWTLLATILVPIVVFWLDTRRHLLKIERENAERLTKVETRLEPIWNWWTGIKEKQ